MVSFVDREFSLEFELWFVLEMLRDTRTFVECKGGGM
jgi:hypothetical protein